MCWMRKRTKRSKRNWASNKRPWLRETDKSERNRHHVENIEIDEEEEGDW